LSTYSKIYHLTQIYTSLTHERDLVQACKRRDRKGQEAVFKRLAGKMMAVCKRYLGTGPLAEDVFMEGFMKVFTKIDLFQEQGSFEGWVRRIMVNEALMALRKEGKMKLQETDFGYEIGQKEDAYVNLEVEELNKLIESLPLGYKTVFNLYAIEGYTHQEIAETLGIQEGTSKSQLSRARGLLQQKLNELHV
jgi:RNA polymerase sigma factor (sigma-70 family)